MVVQVMAERAEASDVMSPTIFTFLMAALLIRISLTSEIASTKVLLLFSLFVMVAMFWNEFSLV